MTRADGTAARTRSSAASIAVATSASERLAGIATFAATSSSSGPRCIVRRWITRSIPPPVSAATIESITRGAADSPSSRLLISTTSTQATLPSSTPIAIEPTPSQRALPVSAASPTPTSAKTSPISAAKSSSSTTTSSGVFECRMKPNQLSAPLTLADSMIAVRNEKHSSTIATTSTTTATAGESSWCGCSTFSTPSYSANSPPSGEQGQGDQERVHVAVASETERVLASSRPGATGGRRSAAAPGCRNRPPSAPPRPASPTTW